MHQHTGDMGVGADRDHLPGAGARADGAGIAGAAGRPDHRGDRAQQGDQRVDVIGAHVQQRPAAGDVVEVRLRMPALMARAHHRRHRRGGHADHTLVDRDASGLGAGAQHRVRGGADEHTRGLRRGEHLGALLRGHREGLLRVHVLARRDRPQIHLGMRRRDREVQDRVHLGVLDQLVHRQHAHALTALRRRGGTGGIQIRHGHQLHVGELVEAVEVLPRDDPAADHPDLHRDASFVTAGRPWSP